MIKNWFKKKIRVPDDKELLQEEYLFLQRHMDYYDDLQSKKKIQIRMKEISDELGKLMGDNVAD